MADGLPNEFDLVVVGTGFPESCIASAASRIGKTVLHLDRNEFYGGVWASFSLENLISLLEQGNLNNELKNACYKWHIPVTRMTQNENQPEAVDESSNETTSTDGSKISQKFQLSQAELLEKSRRFNLDLTPKILYSSGQLVKLLISSNICRYAEFRATDHVCTLFRDELLNVPCSRADVFNSKDLSIIEKRLLMKVLNDCLVYGEEKQDEEALSHRNKTFRDYLTSQKVTEKISTCIMQAIAMCNDNTSFDDGMERTKRFIQSLGHYGNTPFLFPMYGCGEIPQCFCRLCAVFGGIYCLKYPIVDMVLNADTNNVSLMLETGKAVQTKHVITSHGNMPTKFLERITNEQGHGALINKISRGLFITSSPLGNENINSGGGGVNLLRLVSGSKEALVIQLSHFSGTCPKGFYIFHMTTTAESDDPAKDLEPFMLQIFSDKPNTPNLLFSSFFTLTGLKTNLTIDGFPIYCTAAPFYELDYDRSIENARNIFKTMYPDEEFLPRAPDPEEIIVDGEDPRALSEVSLPEDLRAQLHELERSAEQMEIDGTTQISETMEAE